MADAAKWPTCPVCFEEYDDEKCVPIIFPSFCGHSTCASCLPIVMESPSFGSKCVECGKAKYKDVTVDRKNNLLIDTYLNIKRVEQRIAEVEAENDELLEICKTFGAVDGEEEEGEEVSDAEVEADEDQWLCRKKNGPIEAGLRTINDMQFVEKKLILNREILVAKIGELEVRPNRTDWDVGRQIGRFFKFMRTKYEITAVELFCNLLIFVFATCYETIFKIFDSEFDETFPPAMAHISRFMTLLFLELILLLSYDFMKLAYSRVLGRFEDCKNKGVSG